MEHELAQRFFWAERPRLGAATQKVVLQQGVAASETVEYRRRITVPMPPADQTLVDAWKLLRAIVITGFAHLPVGQIDRPTVQGRWPFVGPGVVALEHLGVSHHVKHDRVALVRGIHRMKYVARFDIEPAHIPIATLAWHHADAGGVLRVPRVREPPVSSIWNINAGG